METTSQRPVGPMIGLIVIILLIILGGIYFWTNRDTPINGPENNTETTDDLGRIESQSNSDEAAAIDSDLEAYSESDIDSVDSGL